MWDPSTDAWFSGFADGEATFLLNINRRPRWGRPTIAPRFTLNLRADDVGVLRQLQAAFGGNVNLDPRRDNSQARYFWHVSSKAAMLELVAYFDRFPLRAKKSRDYAIWREAVLLYAARGGGVAFDELSALREALIAGRVFDAPAEDGEELAESMRLMLGEQD